MGRIDGDPSEDDDQAITDTKNDLGHGLLAGNGPQAGNAFNQGSREKKVPAPIGQQTPAYGRGRVVAGDRPMVAGTFFGPPKVLSLGPRLALRCGKMISCSGGGLLSLAVRPARHGGGGLTDCHLTVCSSISGEEPLLAWDSVEKWRTADGFWGTVTETLAL